MKPYSMELRRRVLADRDAGMPTSQVAARHEVSRAWVRRLVQRRRETGEIGPRQQKRHGPKPFLERHEVDLLEILRDQPDASLESISWQLMCRQPDYVSRDSVRKALKQLEAAGKIDSRVSRGNVA